MSQTDNCADGEVCEGYSEVLELVHEINKKFMQIQRREISKADNKEDLTPAQYLLLRQLWENPPLPFKDLAIACSCSKSTVTGVVDTLEKKKLVERIAHPKDRRSTLVKLTKKGRELKESTPSLDSLTNNCCQGINADELRILTILLKRLSSSLTV